MKSALKLVAFSGGCEFSGIIGLLETALEALDQDGQYAAAAHVDMALQAYMRTALAREDRDIPEVGQFG